MNRLVVAGLLIASVILVSGCVSRAGQENTGDKNNLTACCQECIEKGASKDPTGASIEGKQCSEYGRMISDECKTFFDNVKRTTVGQCRVLLPI